MRKLLVGLSVAFLLTLLSAPAWAAPIISSAAINNSTYQITISGKFLMYGRAYNPRYPTKVFFNGTAPLSTFTLLTNAGTPTGTTVTANLPTSLAPGTYVVKILNAYGMSAPFDVTYGAASVNDVGTLGTTVGMLTTRFANLSSSKTAAEAGLNTNIGNTESNLEVETMRAEGAEGTLTTGLGTANTNIAANTTKLASDDTRFGADETNITNLQTTTATYSDLTNETNRAKGAEASLQAGINTVFSNISALKTVKSPSAMQAALLQWYTRTFAVGTNPQGIAFDGTNMWVANVNSNSVSVINAATGSVTNTIAVGVAPQGIAFDGTNMWVANSNDNTVSVINAATGAPALINGGTSKIAVGINPSGIAFDGTNMWVANESTDNVSVINAATGTVVKTVGVGSYPFGIAFDGANMWVTNRGGNNVSVINAATGQLATGFTNPVTVGTNPFSIAFDGTNMWVANDGGTTVSVINAATGAPASNINGGSPVTVGSNPIAIAFDGANMWVTNDGDNTVSVINAATGSFVKAVGVGTNPEGIAFDGANMWVTNYSSNSVTRIPAK